jgi:hypothetical protein
MFSEIVLSRQREICDYELRLYERLSDAFAIHRQSDADKLASQVSLLLLLLLFLLRLL